MRGRLVHGWIGARQVLPCSELLHGKFDSRHCWSAEEMVLGMFHDENLDELTIGVRKV